MTENKTEILKPIVVETFENETNVDMICGLVTPFALENGIKFTDIAKLVKHILETEGLLVSVKARKENCIIDLQDYEDKNHEDYEAMVEWATATAELHDVTKGFALTEFKKILKTDEVPVPTKSTLMGWRLYTVQCFQANPEVTLEEYVECMDSKGVKNANDYKYYYEMAKALVNIELS